jgi:RNA polymerase sigma-70 factor (ECF subfamily)
MPDVSDRELWSRAQRGDSASFEVLFERHFSAVTNYCFWRTADWAASEDLASVAFMTAWQKRHELTLTSDSESLRPWLFGVATNLIRRDRRSAARLARALKRLMTPESNQTSPTKSTVSLPTKSLCVQFSRPFVG